MRRLAFVIYAVIFLDAFLQFALVPLLPDYATELDLSKTQAGIAVATYSLLVLATALPVGHVADRLGARRLTIFGTALMTAATLGLTVAHSFEILVAARAAQGVASAISWTAGLAWLSGAAPPERRGRLLGGSTAVGSAGVLLGPVFAGPLGEHFGIHAPFAVFSVVAALLTVACVLEREAAGTREANVAFRTLARLSSQSRILVLVAVVVTLVGIVSGALETLVPLSLGSDGWSATQISATLAAAGLASVATSVLTARGYSRFGGVRLVLLGVLGTGAAAFVLVPPSLPPLALAALYVIGVPGIAVLYTASFPLATEGADGVGIPHGVVLGAMNMWWGLGFTIGPAAGAALAEATADQVTYGVCAALCVAVFPFVRTLALGRQECQQGA